MLNTLDLNKSEVNIKKKFAAAVCQFASIEMHIFEKTTNMYLNILHNLIRFTLSE